MPPSGKETSILEPREEEGGGVNPSSKPGWEYELNGYWDDDFTNVLDHLSPEAGGIFNASINHAKHRHVNILQTTFFVTHLHRS